MSVTLAIVTLLGSALPAAGETPYAIDLPTHVAATGTLAAVGLIFKLAVQPTLPGGPACAPKEGSNRCDPADLNAFDRLVVGEKSNDWLLATDISVGVMALGALGGTVVDSLSAGSSAPGRDLAVDAVVIAESTAVAVSLTTVLKFAFRRPRPTQYADVGSIRTVEHQLSFPSGHSTTAAALGAAYATTFWLRHPESPWRWVVVGSAAALTAFTSSGRAIGGFHFPTDVIAGTIIGGVTGVLLPLALRKSDGALSVSPGGGAGAGLTLSWVF